MANKCLAVLVIVPLMLVTGCGHQTASGPAKVVSIAASQEAGYAVKSDGTVWSWGNVIEDAGAKLTAVKVNGITGVVAVAADASTAYALKSDGTVWSWGSNTQGFTPSQVAGLTDVTAIAAGQNDGYALKKDGTVWAWGDNTFGQLGCNSNVANSANPVQVWNLKDVVSIVSNVHGARAVKSDGTVWAWGGLSLIPAQVKDPVDTSVKMVAGAYVLKDDSTVWTTDNTTSGIGKSKSIAAQIPGLTDIKEIVSGGARSSSNSNAGTSNQEVYTIDAYALKSNGSVWSIGEKGIPFISSKHASDQVSGMGYVTEIADGQGTIYALNGDGTVLAWGDNTYGQLGDNSIGNSDVPVQVSI